MKDVSVGIDIGGTFTKIGIVDRQGNTLVDDSISTQIEGGFPAYIKYLSEKVKAMLSDFDVQLVGIGVGAPNGNYYSGTIEHAPNLKWHGVIHFSKAMQEYFDVPVILTNDANAAAIGEMVYGGAKGMKDFIVFTLGTGLGSGIVANGQLIYGHDGFAGEIGHTIVNPNGRVCGCGRKGCLETYVSATGITRTVYKLIADYMVDSELRGVSFNDLTAKMITEAAIRKDPLAIKAFEYTGEILGRKLADTVAHFSPEAIFLFGGLVKAGEYLLKPTKYQMDANMLSVYKNKVKLLPSALTDTNAAVMGASSLVWKEIEDKN